MISSSPIHIKETDPGFIEGFEIYAFDEVLRYGGLDTRTRLMVILATLLGVVTQLLPYVGYPGTLNAIQCLNEIVPEV